MFSDAYEKTSKFTQPIVVSTRHYDGSVNCSLGAYILLNKEGWALSAAHVLSAIPVYNQHQKEIQIYNKQKSSIEANTQMSKKQRTRSLRQLKPNPKWITNFSFWWGWDSVRYKNTIVFPEGDLILMQLEGVDLAIITEFPTIKNSAKNMMCGTSLCKLGYPFHSINATFDESTGNFKLEEGALPIPRFPIEGIFTRNLIVGKTKDDMPIKFIETSSPGLRGQSGGPIFDTQGTVWGIQSRTSHLPLGFSPKIKKGHKIIEENQFLNFGLGVHPETIQKFLDDNNISYAISDY